MPFSPFALREIREKHGLTQEQVAAKTGAHRVSVARWETGTRTPTINQLEKLAVALEVDVDDLLKTSVHGQLAAKTAAGSRGKASRG